MGACRERCCPCTRLLAPPGALPALGTTMAPYQEVAKFCKDVLLDHTSIKIVGGKQSQKKLFRTLAVIVEVVTVMTSSNSNPK